MNAQFTPTDIPLLYNILALALVMTLSLCLYLYRKVQALAATLEQDFVPADSYYELEYDVRTLKEALDQCGYEL